MRTTQIAIDAFKMAALNIDKNLASGLEDLATAVQELQNVQGSQDNSIAKVITMTTEILQTLTQLSNKIDKITKRLNVQDMFGGTK